MDVAVAASDPGDGTPRTAGAGFTWQIVGDVTAPGSVIWTNGCPAVTWTAATAAANTTTTVTWH